MIEDLNIKFLFPTLCPCNIIVYKLFHSQRPLSGSSPPEDKWIHNVKYIYFYYPNQNNNQPIIICTIYRKPIEGDLFITYNSNPLCKKELGGEESATGIRKGGNGYTNNNSERHSKERANCKSAKVKRTIDTSFRNCQDRRGKKEQN